MEKVIDLKDLLKHEIMDLYSAEEQIIEALPLMIEKAGNEKLKAALKDHLKVTEEQKSRLDDIQQLLAETPAESDATESKKPGFFSRLFGDGEQKCKGMEGLIAEGKKMMSTDMSPEAADAAIIASAQKIEHYEISGYGTARAFARELNLGEVAYKLEQTLKEEYEADDLLTRLAVGRLNIEAEFARDSENGSSKSKENGDGRSKENGSSRLKKNGINKSKENGTSRSKITHAKSNGRSNAGAATASNTKNGNTAKSNGKKVSVKKSSIKSKPSKSPSKSSAPKKSNSLTKKGSSNARTSNLAGKSKSAGKKSAAKSSKGSNNKSSSSKNRSSRSR